MLHARRTGHVVLAFNDLDRAPLQKDNAVVVNLENTCPVVSVKRAHLAAKVNFVKIVPVLPRAPVKIARRENLKISQVALPHNAEMF